MHAVGHVRGVYTNTVTGREMEIFHQRNLILHEGADIMAALLAGRREFIPSHMYFHFENTNGGITTPPTLSREDGGAFFRGMDGEDPPHDWLRVPIITTPMLISGGDTYQGNIVSFSASSATSESLLGESPEQRYFASSGDDGPSKVFGLALVAETIKGSKNGDKVFSRLALDTPSVMLPGNHLTFYWMIEFK